MDVKNDKLKVLFTRVDEAFKALMQNPGNQSLHDEYESAKHELDLCLSAMRRDLSPTPIKSNPKHH